VQVLSRSVAMSAFCQSNIANKEQKHRAQNHQFKQLA